MSQENVELVKALIPQPDADWSQLIRDDDAFERMRESVSPFFTDDFQSVMVWPAVNRTYAGLEGLRKNWLDWLEPWATYRITIDELIDAGERVVVLSRNYGRRKDMETEVELIAAATLTFKEGKIARWEDYADRAAALEAAGLAEDARTSS
jgi:ketosteroid isomerase-like protein